MFTAFANYGQVDNTSLPSIALPPIAGYSSGSVGASVRQSIIGLTGYGPTLFGAHTSADIQMDFFGGVPTTYGGSNSGIAELRVARFRMDWSKTSVVAGLDYPFFAPNLPTSYMTVVVPGFASAGKMWSWTPTIRAEHRFDGAFSAFKVEAGFLAPQVIQLLRAEYERADFVAVGEFAAADLCDENFGEHALGRSAGDDRIWRRSIRRSGSWADTTCRAGRERWIGSFRCCRIPNSAANFLPGAASMDSAACR